MTTNSLWTATPARLHDSSTLDRGLIGGSPLVRPCKERAVLSCKCYFFSFKYAYSNSMLKFRHNVCNPRQEYGRELQPRVCGAQGKPMTREKS